MERLQRLRGVCESIPRVGRRSDPNPWAEILNAFSVSVPIYVP